jgi:hypothetical protein
VHTTVNAAVRDPGGVLPGSIQALEVTGPGGFSEDLLTGHFSSSDKVFFKTVEGSPSPGVYTFTMQDEDGNTAVTRDWLGSSDDMPLVDRASIAISGNAAAPVVSWSGVSGYPGVCYYRIWVEDMDGRLIYKSWRGTSTAQVIPEGKLEIGKNYTVHIEAHDQGDWVVFNTRSNSKTVWWSTEGGSLPGVPLTGDINGDLMIDLGDAILALQVVADLNPSGVHLGDANADGKVGLAEAIYVLQYESQLR